MAAAEAEAFTEEDATEGEGEAEAVADSVVTKVEYLDWTEEDEAAAADALEDPL